MEQILNAFQSNYVFVNVLSLGCLFMVKEQLVHFAVANQDEDALFRTIRCNKEI